MNELNFSLAIGWIAGLLALGWLWYAGPEVDDELQPIIITDEEPADTDIDAVPEDISDGDIEEWDIDYQDEGGILDNAGLSVNQAGLAIIKDNEGLELIAYQGPDGGYHIGYGHGADVVPGMTITATEAEELLIEDVAGIENAIRAAITVPLNDNEFSALVSFTYNVGTSAFWSSTVLTELNAGNRVAAADNLMMWNKMSRDGELIENMALTERRIGERKLFLTPTD